MKIELKSTLKKRKMSQQSLADAIEVSKGYISEIANGIKHPSIETLELILNALDADISELIPSRHTVAVAGKVGAGARVELSDPHPKGEGLYKIACPPQIGSHGIVAVEVCGNSMEPAYEDGDVLFYSRDTLGIPSEAIGRRCVVETTDGMVWAKLLRRRDGQPEGLFDLISFHADTPPMYDVTIKWAAPIKMHLGRDLIIKV
ncbi:MAG: XRE family transcriptional regulator [Litorimonas sp.]